MACATQPNAVGNGVSVYTQTWELPVEQLTELLVRGVEGGLRMVGEPGRDLITVEVEVMRDEVDTGWNDEGDEEFVGAMTLAGWDAQAAEGVDFTLYVPPEGAGSVDVAFDGSGLAGFFDTPEYWTDTTIHLPAEVLAQVSGFHQVELYRLAGVTLDDGSGDSWVHDINGPTTITDRGGLLSVYFITGDVDIVDERGRLQVTDVVGNVHIDDENGTVRVCRVDGDLTVHDGRGRLRVEDVSGEVTRY